MVADLLGWQGEGMGSHNLMISGEVAIRGLVRDMFPVSKCMGYISFPRSSLGQAEGLLHRPTGRIGEHAFPP